MSDDDRIKALEQECLALRARLMGLEGEIAVHQNRVDLELTTLTRLVSEAAPPWWLRWLGVHR